MGSIMLTNLERCAEIQYTFGGFGRPLFVYTPSLSLPLFKGGERSWARGGTDSAARQVIDISEQLSRRTRRIA